MGSCCDLRTGSRTEKPIDDIWQYTVSRTDTVSTVALSGELDMVGRDALTEVLLAEISRPGPAAICVDLAGVTFMGSTGLMVLLKAQGEAAAAGRHLCVTGMSGVALRVLHISGLLPILTDSPVLPADTPPTLPGADPQAS